ncbi:MAG: hypothetical protein VX026_09140 [Myxococcota bacterium]|nr:hypothetical protein [Myxococcota bacterium]
MPSLRRLHAQLPILVIPICIGMWIFVPQGILGHPMGDMADHFWGNRWFAQELSQFRLPIYTQNTHFPEGGYLWHIDPIGGLLQFLTVWLSPHAAWHFGIFVQLSAMGTMMALYANSKLKDLPISVGLGLALVFSAHVLGLLHSGLSEYLGIAWLIALLWSLDSAKTNRTGILLGICFWQAAPYGLLGALLTILKRWRSPKQLLPIALISGVVAGPAIIAIQWTASHPDAAFQLSEAAGWNPQTLPSIDLLGWFMPGNWLHPNTPELGNPGILQPHSLSLTVLGLLIVGLIRQSSQNKGLMQYWPIVVLMLGPRLSINRWMPLDGTFYLPMAVLYLPGLPTNAFHHPYHITAIILPIALIVAGRTLIGFSRGIQMMVFGVYLFESSISPAGLFPERTPVPQPIVTNGPVIDWPPDRHVPNRMYLLAHSYHGQATYSGVSQWLSPCLLTSYEIESALNALDDPAYRTINRDQHTPLKRPQPTHSWQTCGFTQLVVHKEYLSGNELTKIRQYLNSELGLPMQENAQVIHYQIPNMTVE